MLTPTSSELDVLSSASYLGGLPLDEAWVISRHEDVVRVEHDEQHFSAGPAFTLHRRPVFDKPHLLNTDGDEHAQL